MNQYLENYFTVNWKNIYSDIQKNWDRLSIDDIQQIDGSYDIFLGKIKKRYGHTKPQIDIELLALLSKKEAMNYYHQVDPVWNKKNINHFSLKDRLEKFISDCFLLLRDQSVGLEKDLIIYARRNSIKVFGLVIILGFLAHKMSFTKQN